jgi:hypothetical protein
MSTIVPSQGSETRTSILPSMTSLNMGFFGSPYNPADAMKTPNEIGVRVGNSMSDVVDAVKGVGFYTDQIGFGAPSTGLTRGMPLEPLGVNYFVKTGQQCSNGADMWEYIQGIPDGSALGENTKRAMEEMGLPPLKGLAPGMIEDVKRAFNPVPIMNSLFGSGYPQCVKSGKLPVGDAYGRYKDPNTQESWISDPDTVMMLEGKPVQEKWIQEKNSKGVPINLTRDQWVSTKKGYNRDGTAITNESFEGIITKPVTIISVGILCLIALGFIKKK